MGGGESYVTPMRTRARCLRCLMYRAAATAAAPATAAAKRTCLLSMPRTRSSGCSEFAILIKSAVASTVWQQTTRFDGPSLNMLAKAEPPDANVQYDGASTQGRAQHLSVIERHHHRPLA